jgi:hypothetical protein
MNWDISWEGLPTWPQFSVSKGYPQELVDYQPEAFHPSAWAGVLVITAQSFSIAHLLRTVPFQPLDHLQ